MHGQPARVLLALLGHLLDVLRQIMTSASVQAVFGHVAIDFDGASKRSGDFLCGIHTGQLALASDVPFRPHLSRGLVYRMRGRLILELHRKKIDRSFRQEVSMAHSENIFDARNASDKPIVF